MSKRIIFVLTATLALAFYALQSADADTKESEGHSGEAHSHSAKPQDAHDHGGASYSVGEPADAAEADRTVEVVMSDVMTYTFTPDLSSINNGEVINFVVINDGKINHEFSIGNAEDQKEHATMMAQMPNMVHDDPNTVTVQPGQSKSLAWRFQGDDLVVFACNIPGHYQAGMFKKTGIT